MPVGRDGEGGRTKWLRRRNGGILMVPRLAGGIFVWAMLYRKRLA